MDMQIEILDADGNVVARVVASAEWADSKHPGRWRAVQDIAQPSQFERDQARYAKRAAAKDGLLAYMAADNMSRVRSGEWTVAQLTSLMADPALAAANAYMSTLSFELAAQAIAQAQTPLLTPSIRADWIARLQGAFFLEG